MVDIASQCQASKVAGARVKSDQPGGLPVLIGPPRHLFKRIEVRAARQAERVNRKLSLRDRWSTIQYTPMLISRDRRISPSAIASSRSSDSFPRRLERNPASVSLSRTGRPAGTAIGSLQDDRGRRHILLICPPPSKAALYALGANAAANTRSPSAPLNRSCP